MITFQPEYYLSLKEHFLSIRQILAGKINDPLLTPEWALEATLKDQLPGLAADLERIGFQTTRQQAARLQAWLSLPNADRPPLEVVRQGMAELCNRLEDECRQRSFYVLAPEQQARYSEPLHIWGDAPVKFPSAVFDMEEASRASALERHTASVFHLMRVLEIGLSVLADTFGIQADHTNWQNIIDQIERAIRRIPQDPNKPPDWKEQQEYYSQTVSGFMFFKDAWRNYTAHARGQYTPTQAESIFLNVSMFMKQLATRMSE